MKYSKIFRALAVALTLALLAIAIPSTPALAATVGVAPLKGKVLGTVEAYGAGFTANTTIWVYFAANNAEVGNAIDTNVTAYERVKIANTNSVGSFNISFQVLERLTGGSVQEKVRRGTYYVYVTYANSKQIEARAEFTVEVAGVVTLDPNTGQVGTGIQITGTEFDRQENITVNYDDVPVAIKSGNTATDTNGAFKCTILIPASTGGIHIIKVIGNSSLAEATAEVTVQPKITISPESGVAGDTISVNGTGFGNEVTFRISFDGVNVVGAGTTGSDGSFKATFAALSRQLGSYEIAADDDATNSGKATFAVVTTAINLSTTTGYVGSAVTISGSGFQAGKEVSIGFGRVLVKTVPADNSGKFSTSFNVPIQAAGTYVVKAGDGTNEAQVKFSITASISTSPVTSTASPGHVGSELTINGVGFTPGKQVTISYDGKQIDTATVSTNATFTAAFKAPASLGGNHTIAASDGTNTQQVTFVMESTPPSAPKPLKPEMGIKARAEPLFDWEDVTDPSGVTYTLQIATSENFSQGSIVLEKTGLTKSEYTLTSKESLKSTSKKSPYYWHVRATDGASNASRWSGTGTLYVGFSFELSQTIIYVLIAIGVLLLGFLGFWLGRRTAYY